MSKIAFDSHIPIDSATARAYASMDDIFGVENYDYELKVHRAIERNKYEQDYCRNGVEQTTVFWDDVDSSLYGCAGKFTDANGDYIIYGGKP